VNGPRLARDLWTCSTEVACSHVSGLLTQPGWTAGPDGVREPRPHHSSGIGVPMRRQAALGCVGSTDCAITRHCSLASSRTWPGLSRRGHALVIFLPLHHSPGHARGLVRQRHGDIASSDPAIKARVVDLGGLVLPPSSPTEFGKFLASDTEKWARVIRTANIKAD
jgi:hypothetical protein